MAKRDGRKGSSVPWRMGCLVWWEKAGDVLPGDDGGEALRAILVPLPASSFPESEFRALLQQIVRREFLRVWGIHGEKSFLLLLIAHESDTENYSHERAMRAYGNFSAKLWEQAARWVLANQHKHGSKWAAIVALASEIGCPRSTLRDWVDLAERYDGDHPSLTSNERERQSSEPVVVPKSTIP